MNRQEFAQLAAEEILLLDGAFGSNMYKKGMPRGVCTESWVLDHKELMQELQIEYANAGSRIIYAPTFAANRAVLQGFGMADRVGELNSGLVKATKAALDGRGVLIAGDLTTTGKPMAPYGEMTYDYLYEIYKEQIEILAEAGVDLLVAETMLSVDECMPIVDAANAVCDLPIMVSMSLNADGTGIYGGSGAEAVETLQAMGASAVGVNCSVGPDQLVSVVTSMKNVAEIPVLVKPNAGMPIITEKGEAVYLMKPDQFAKGMKTLIECGAGIVGGCCGTTPDYIRALKQVI